jgi:hypothetical protein
MSYEIDMKPDGDLMVVTLRGQSHRKREVADFQLILDQCIESEATKVLIDYRELVGVPVSTGETFKYISEVNQLYFRHVSNGGKALRIVYLAPRNDPRAEGLDAQFALTVAENFGFPVMLTFDQEQAREWLGEGS